MPIAKEKVSEIVQAQRVGWVERSETHHNNEQSNRP